MYTSLCLFSGLDIVSLVLRNNQITQIHNNAFSGLNFVRTVDDYPELDFSDNHLQSIERHAFSGILGSLNGIYFRNCSLTEFPLEAVRHISTLTYITIADNQFTDIPNGTFGVFPDLSWLLFDGNTFRGLDREGLLSGVESSLTLVSLKDMGWTTFPSKLLRKLKKIAYVMLSNNDIKTLKADMFKGFQTTMPLTVVLYSNNINCISQHFLRGTTIKLQNLDLSHNQLTSLDFVDICLPAFQYDWNNHHPRILAKGNPLDCHCDLLNLANRQDVKVYATCEQPPPYHGKTLNASRLQSYDETGEFKCPRIDPIVCPSGCDSLMTSSVLTVASVTCISVTMLWMV